MKRPRVHIWTFIYFFLGTASFLFLCLWSIKDGWFPSEIVLRKHPDPSDHFYLFNQSLSVYSGVLFLLATIPIWIMAFGKSRSWVWITTLVFIALGIPNNPLMGIPVLIFWVKDRNKEYYGQLPRPHPVDGEINEQ